MQHDYIDRGFKITTENNATHITHHTYHTQNATHIDRGFVLTPSSRTVRLM